MVKILFVCYGNICRSPMAEYVMKDLVSQYGVYDGFVIESAATSAWEVGNPAHWGTKERLEQEGIDCSAHKARQVVSSDYEKYDYIVGMDQSNVDDLRRKFGGDKSAKVYRLLEFAGEERDIADPYYTGDFNATYEDVKDGCVGMLGFLGIR